MNKLTYATIYSEDISNINFDDVIETNQSDLIYNNNRSQTFVTFSGDLPHSVQLIHKGLHETPPIKYLTYGFILKEDLQYINIIELYQNVRYTDDESMFMVSWIGDTPPALHGLLEIVVDTEEQVNQIMSGEWNVE